MSTQPFPTLNLSSESCQPTDILYRSLKTAITKECTGRHDTDVRLRRQDDSDDSTLHVELDCSLLQMSVRIHVTHTGGNVYDICCSVEDGPSSRFSYSLPTYEGEGTVLSRAPCLGEKLASFLLDELEQQLGRLLLCGSLEPELQGSTP